MQLNPSVQVDRHQIAVVVGESAPRPTDERLIALSSWMMVLGTIRFVCIFADTASAFLGAYKFEPVSMRMLSKFAEENQMVLALSVAWPLLIAIALRRVRWPEILPAAGITFLILSLVGVLEVMAGWNHSRIDGIVFGSFHLTRRALLNPTLADVTLGLLGLGQLVFECATGLRALQLAHTIRAARAHNVPGERHESSRRARFGRLAIYASLGFLVLMIRLPVWATYVDLINDSRIVREFVLKNDIKRIHSQPPSRPMTREEEQARVLHMMLASSYGAVRSTHFMEAKESYLRLIEHAESSSEGTVAPGSVAVVAEAQNNLAWLLATCRNTELRDPRAAVEHARRAVELEPKQGNYWNTLGVAYCRDGQWDLAKDALNQSMKLRGDGDSFDWFFLALVDFKQGHKAQAQAWFEKAVNWHEQFSPDDEELRRFHVEVARELGVPEPRRTQPQPPGR
jgi:hypothetical protein